jgi:hypothetical protein
VAPVRSSIDEGAFPVPPSAPPSPPVASSLSTPGPGPAAGKPLEQRVAALEAEVARLARLYQELSAKSTN